MWRKGNPCALLVGKQIGTATVESSMELPQKIKNGGALWPIDSTSGNISKETWNTSLKKDMHPYVLCSIIYNSQDLEEAQASANHYMNGYKSCGTFTQLNTTQL